MEKNHLFHIDRVWIAISVDEYGHEGVCAVPMGGMGMMPLIAADERRLADIVPMAQKISEMQNCVVKIIRLTTRDEIAVFGADVEPPRQ